MVTRKNYWIANDEAFATWSIEFPAITTEREVLQLAEYQIEILEFAAELEIFTVYGTPSPDKYEFTEKMTYPEFLRRQLRSTGTMPFFRFRPKVGDVDQRYFDTRCRISYVDHSDNIVDRQVKNIGDLLRDLRSTDISRSAPSYASNISPVTIWGNEYNLLNQTGTNNDIWFYIDLRTDIWFPQVIGFMDYDTKEGKSPYDNSHLALRHTPRLNTFLSKAHELTELYGGQ